MPKSDICVHRTARQDNSKTGDINVVWGTCKQGNYMWDGPGDPRTGSNTTMTSIKLGRGGGVFVKCEVMGFCLKLATSKKGGGFTPFARN